jgi:hypothetical protein
MQCEARSKQTGERCRRHATPGRAVCYYHGGRTPRGFGLPHTKTGWHSRDLPTRLGARYEEAQQDPTLVELRDELALLDARIADVLQRVDTGESGEIWERLHTEMAAFTTAERARDAKTMAQHLQTMRHLIQHGLGDSAAWGEVYTLIEHRRRVADSERRRLVDLHQMLSVEQAMLLVAQLAAIVRTHVQDRQVLAAIHADLQRLGTAASPFVEQDAGVHR